MSDFKLSQISIYVSASLKEYRVLETYYKHKGDEERVKEIQAQIRVLTDVDKFVSSLL